MLTDRAARQVTSSPVHVAWLVQDFVSGSTGTFLVQCLVREHLGAHADRYPPGNRRTVRKVKVRRAWFGLTQARATHPDALDGRFAGFLTASPARGGGDVPPLLLPHLVGESADVAKLAATSQGDLHVDVLSPSAQRGGDGP